MKKLLLIILLATSLTELLQAQSNQTYWQQRAEYEMNVSMNVETNRFTGDQKLTYYNNSPDTLNRAFYHLYFNAFQPGSMMDVRSLTIADPDRRVGDRIANLAPDEIGYQHVLELKQNGKDVSHKVAGTILEVWLNEPILPGGKAVFTMKFEGQVPLQVRRSGRDNEEGIKYSMSQWYPKLAEYDMRGWHANPYIGREFHGVWGDFDVKITIDPTYTVAGTGILQNPNKIGHGYEEEGKSVKPATEPLTWHFKASNVHDFMWAADPDYTHDKAQVPGGPMLHFFYEKNEKTEENWKKLQEYMVKAVPFMNEHFGVYPYEVYSFIQGGDGGMEYPMSTLITGNRSLNSLVGVAVHEMFHSWYQGVLGFNESLYPWMDEGFTSFASNITMDYLMNEERSYNPHGRSYAGYFRQARSGEEEPLTTHADMYHTNASYGINAYSKGAVFLGQLAYIIGQENLMKGMRRFYNEWKFKHPTDIDLIRVLEKVSGIQLGWYQLNFVNTTNQVDYGINQVSETNGQTIVTLERVKDMMMPVDLYVEYQDGSTEILYIPLRIMRGEKPVENEEVARITMEAWPWTYPQYTLKINRPVSEIKRMEIDPTQRMADIDRSNNVYDNSGELQPFSDPTK
jgi:hypothetical protein